MLLEVQPGMTLCRFKICDKMCAVRGQNGVRLCICKGLNREKKDNVDERMEVDFLVAKNGIGRRHNISAVEVKKTKRIAFSSLTKFKAKFASELATSYVVHTGAYAKDEDPVRLPVYLLPFVL